MSPINRHLAGVVAFLTSAAVLVMEIVASRLLAPYVGVTLQTYTAIIGVVLTGISLGTWLGGRLADAHGPTRLLPAVLLIGGGLVFASLFALRLAAKVFDGTGPWTAVALVLSAFLLPATVLSMVPPMLVKASLADLTRTGREVGRISALGTAGAIVGTFVAGFVLVATIPSPAILVVVGGLLVVMGLGLWAVLRPGSGRFPLAALLVAGGGGATLPMYESRCDVETAYFCASVINDGPYKVLKLDTLWHSEVDLTSDTNLLFEYTRALGGAIDVFRPSTEEVRALHIGGGGFSVPRYVRATRPGSTNVVIERDPALIELGKEKLGLVLGDGLTARSMDGRVAVRTAESASYDVVIGDAFGGEAVPWHLATKEFLEEVRRVLTPNGLYLLNEIDAGPARFARAEAKTVANVFDHVAVVAYPGDFVETHGANFVVLASDDPLPIDALRARYEEMGMGVEVREGAALQRWIGDAQILTDAFAPVDQLLTTGG